MKETEKQPILTNSFEGKARPFFISLNTLGN